MCNNGKKLRTINAERRACETNDGPPRPAGISEVTAGGGSLGRWHLASNRHLSRVASGRRNETGVAPSTTVESGWGLAASGR
jgi:hypothetical protein